MPCGSEHDAFLGDFNRALRIPAGMHEMLPAGGGGSAPPVRAPPSPPSPSRGRESHRYPPTLPQPGFRFQAPHNFASVQSIKPRSATVHGRCCGPSINATASSHAVMKSVGHLVAQLPVAVAVIDRRHPLARPPSPEGLPGNPASPALGAPKPSPPPHDPLFGCQSPLLRWRSPVAAVTPHIASAQAIDHSAAGSRRTGRRSLEYEGHPLRPNQPVEHRIHKGHRLVLAYAHGRLLIGPSHQLARATPWYGQPVGPVARVFRDPIRQDHL